MLRNILWLISVIILLALAGNGFAANWWYGTVDSNWFNPGNYSDGYVPDANNGVNMSVSDVGTHNPMILASGDAHCSSMWSYNEQGSTTFWSVTGGNLTIHSGYCLLGSGSAGGDTIFEITAGTVNAGDAMRVGRFLSGATGTGYLNMTGGTMYTDILIVGSVTDWYTGKGVVNLDGGTINASDLAMEPTCLINITEGKIVITGDVTSDVNNYISNGWIKAYGGAGTVIVEFEEGFTTITSLDPRVASEPYPDDGQQEIPRDGVVLTWLPGIYADKHTVFFGTSLTDVNESATPVSIEEDANSYGPLDFDIDQQYFWRVDEVNSAEPNTWTGKIWSFKTGGYVVVDDMESYNDDFNLIIFTWADGTIGNTSGSIIYLQQGPPVHGGNQSMRYIYKNDGSTGTPYYSEIRRSFSAEDWTDGGHIKGLVLFFKGDPGNDPEQMYVALSDGTTTAVSVHPNANAAQLDDWQQWAMGFDDFAGVNPEHIETLYIGFGDRDSHPDPSGTGTVYFDDIRRYPAICLYKPDYDYNDDCVVDFKDLAIFSAAWIGTDRELWP